MDSARMLKEVAAQVAACTACALHYSRKKSVPGEGDAKAQVMLVGEGPGFYENEQGRPFVGPSGDFLDDLLKKAGIERKGVFITNVVKCRPPGNRDPSPEELQACGGFLERQIDAIQPLVVVTLGRYSMTRFLPNVKISEIHGQASWVRGRLVVPMFHPAAALHQPSLRPALERDFTRLPEWIEQARQSGRITERQEGRRKRAAAGVAEVGPGYGPEDAEPVAAAPPLQQAMLGLFDPPPAEPVPPEVEPDDAALSKGKPTQLSFF